MPGGKAIYTMTDLQIPSAITALYDHAGPFATVYLDGSRASESGAHEVELRVRAQCERLTDAGADTDTVAALARAVEAHGDVAGSHGLALVAAHGQVLLDEVLPEPPARELADWSPLPHVTPLLAGTTPQVPHVVVIADHHGADLRVVDAAGGVEKITVQGSHQYPMHLTARDEWDERHVQNRTQDSWAMNAREVAGAAGESARGIHAELVVVGGDPRSVGLLRDELAHALGPSVRITVIEDASRAPGAADVEAKVRDAVHNHVVRQRHEVLEHLQQNLGREKFAVAGVEPVVDALRKSQVDTVVLSDDPSSTLTAWIGPAPLDVATSPEDLVAVDEPRQVRFDAALIRAVAGSGAQLLVTPNAHRYVEDGIAALLRY